MDLRGLGADALKIVQEILGYLNFASGAPDPQFLKNLSELFGLIEDHRDRVEPAWVVLGQALRAALEGLRGSSEAFRRVDQAEAVLALVFDHTLPAYRRHHRDLLFHQTDEQLFQPLFLGRVCEAVLLQGGPWEETDRIAGGALRHLNDYLGHRPVSVLQTEQKIQPYAHERVRPIPLYVREVGAAVGPYRELIEKALEILAATDAEPLFQAWFDPALLDELALDPRAYDFDHPVNKRPNYLFGQWDLQRLDNSGYCRRFVLQQVSLSAMLSRVQERGKLPYAEALFEAAAVLAGTMLMGSGVSGNRPDAHGSSTTLATLIQHIAVYRDEFYEQLLARLSGPHAERLRAEAVKLRQPFGGARQHFNQYLARRRAEQLQHVHLGRLFARMGSAEAATRQVRVVPVASARMQCEMYCRLSTARLEIERGRLDRAASLLPEIEDLLHRAIECGALVDPWNILGFGGQYSLFPALENSVPDHRVDELLELLGEIFALHVWVKKEAAAAGNSEVQDALSARLDKLARWWDQFASVVVGAVEGISGAETCQSADQVAAALRAWHAAGTAAGDVAFWRGHAEGFSSPKSYALVVETLLEQGDPVAAMALLVHWLSQAREISLVEEGYSFHELALRWMKELWRTDDQSHPHPVAPDDRWPLSRKFLDYLEANAEEYGEAPRFELAGQTSGEADAPQEEPDRPHDLFGAAYENVTYRDSTDDGVAGEVLDGGEHATNFELTQETERLAGRLAFLATLAELWKSAAVASMSADAARPAAGTSKTSRRCEERDEVLSGWLRRAMANHRRLSELLRAVHRYRIPPPRGTLETLVEYDQHRVIKEMLLDQIITTCVETADAGRVIRAAIGHHQPASNLDEWEEPVEQVLRALLRGDVAAVRKGWNALIGALRKQPLLYVALGKGGNPERVTASRGVQCVLRRLLTYLPRFGLLRETSRLIEVAQKMELEHLVGRHAITEFDQLFRIGCRGIVRCLVISSEDWHSQPDQADPELIDCLERTTEVLLRCWLVHSRGVRLSVLEAVGAPKPWQKLKQFIERYGADLFTQHFMGLGNLRGILHQGVDAWLESLEEERDSQEQPRLLTELERPLGGKRPGPAGGRLKRDDAVQHLGLILEAVVENYPEYVDYNSITTQSDRGEMLYTLLDFLRLRANYERVTWNMQPVLLAHEVLVRCGRDRAAEIWRNAISDRTVEIADDYLKRLARLGRKYGMHLPSIADRLGQRFVRPLTIDRLRALVRPAIDELRGGRESAAFARLEEGIAQLTEEPSGAGFEVPAWLEALEEEVDQALTQGAETNAESLDPYLPIPQVRLSAHEFEFWGQAGIRD